MIPTILYGGTIEERAAEVTAKYPSNKYAVTHIAAEKTSILISQIHDLLKNLSISANVERVIWLEEAHKLTLPAQNALLKILEEPPAKTNFILTVNTPQSLLATICSRCRLVKLAGTAELKLDGLELSTIKQALSLSPGDRVLSASALGAKREVLLVWTENCLTLLERKMRTEKSAKSLQILAKIAALVHAAHTDLNSNVNVGLAMQHLFLSLPRVGSRS